MASAINKQQYNCNTLKHKIIYQIDTLHNNNFYVGNKSHPLTSHFDKTVANSKNSTR